jgi:uncharacterized protein (TIGR02646 family)
MLIIQNIPLNPAEATHLSAKQMIINSLTSYSEQVSRGKALWKSKNDNHFKEIRKILTSMCVGIRRCSYCEDSVADEVEHIKPKDLYPDVVFVWSNYLYACGNCNGPKNNKFAILDAQGNIIDVTRPQDAPVTPPAIGPDAFINPRTENPLVFMRLDLSTMRFVPKRRISDTDRKRVEYTIKTLGLNSRDFLVESRKAAYNTYVDTVKSYEVDKNNGVSNAKLLIKKKKFKNLPHQTVWVEIKSQHSIYLPLQGLFDNVPELLI